MHLTIKITILQGNMSCTDQNKISNKNFMIKDRNLDYEKRTKQDHEEGFCKRIENLWKNKI